MCRASQSLAGSLIINPCEYLFLQWDCADYSGDVDSTASAIHTALTLSPQVREQNWTKLFSVSHKYVTAADLQYVSKYVHKMITSRRHTWNTNRQLHGTVLGIVVPQRAESLDRSTSVGTSAWRAPQVKLQSQPDEFQNQHEAPLHSWQFFSDNPEGGTQQTGVMKSCSYCTEASALVQRKVYAALTFVPSNPDRALSHFCRLRVFRCRRRL